jgi:hypothetical protein
MNHYENRDGEGVYPRSLGTCKPLRETDKALLVMRDDLTELWVPKSVIHDDSEVYSVRSGAGELFVEEWFAAKEGL